MFTHFTNAYFFTSIVTTAIGYGAQEHIYINSKTFKAMTSIFTDNVLLLTLLSALSIFASKFTDTETGQIFLIFFALIAIPYTNFCIGRITLGQDIHTAPRHGPK